MYHSIRVWVRKIPKETQQQVSTQPEKNPVPKSQPSLHKKRTKTPGRKKETSNLSTFPGAACSLSSKGRGT
jgi:hypothetical protein